jgi:hypothetical protein
MQKVQEILAALEALDLSKYPYQETKDLIGSIGSAAAIKYFLHPGKVIMRAVPNHNGERFSKISRISYKPQDLNKTYQRASTPHNSMFYGSTISEKLKEGELDMERIMGLFEAIPLCRDVKSEGEQIITYSKWEIVKDIPLLAFIHNTSFPKDNSEAAEMRAYFQESLENLPPELSEKSRLVTAFLSNQFAKDITPHDYDYMISAIYTEMLIVNEHAGGVLYPSVRTGGDGFNVAIHPYYFDNGYLIPKVVGECTIYKRGLKTVLDNDTIAILEPGQIEFTLEPVKPEYHTGKDKIMRYLYPEIYM